MDELFEPKIIFEDEHLLIVDKRAGMVVNRADTVKGRETLQEWVEKQLTIDKGQLVDKESDFIKRSGIAHRLDKETSGLVIITKDEESFKNLQQQFKEGRVEKTYIALVHGKVVPETGEINVPVGRLPWNRMRFGVLPKGRESRTLYKVIGVWSGKWEVSRGWEVWMRKILSSTPPTSKPTSHFSSIPLSLLEVYPKTGRTHQIRVHFQYIGHPIFADELYAGRKMKKKDRKLLSRHFLHAVRIAFVHPKTGNRVEFESLLPQNLVDFLDNLQ